MHEKSKEDLITCEECGKSFLYKSHKMRHMLSHSKEVNFFCPDHTRRDTCCRILKKLIFFAPKRNVERDKVSKACRIINAMWQRTDPTRYHVLLAVVFTWKRQSTK